MESVIAVKLIALRGVCKVAVEKMALGVLAIATVIGILITLSYSAFLGVNYDFEPPTVKLVECSNNEANQSFEWKCLPIINVITGSVFECSQNIAQDTSGDSCIFNHKVDVVTPIETFRESIVLTSSYDFEVKFFDYFLIFYTVLLILTIVLYIRGFV